MGRRLQLEAIAEKMRAQLVEDGLSAPLHNNLGAVLTELGRFAEAMDCYRESIRLDPSYMVARSNMVRANEWRQTRVADDVVLGLIRRLRPIEPASGLIRVGGESDGAYLMPDDLLGVRYCFSPGVGPVVNFELDMEKRGIHSFLADASVEGPARTLSNYTFDKKFLGERSNETTLTLPEWLDLRLPAGDTSDLVMQMDIEGSEYGVIRQAPAETLKRFRIIVIEFHFLNALRYADRSQEIVHCFGKLLEHFHVAHLHPNNCCGSTVIAGVDVPQVLEVTFLRKDRDPGDRRAVLAPHPLDVNNVDDKPPLVLDPKFLGL